PAPARPSPVPAPERRAPAEPLAAGPAMQTLIGKWAQIRREVRVANSRIAALLSSVDPVAVRGDEVVLVSAYEFHRNKLSDDAVRRVVEDVINRHIGGSYRVTCVAPEEAPSADAGAPAPPVATPSNGSYVAPSPAPEPDPEPEPELPADADDEERPRAARSTLDSEEV